ncbi:plakophilin-1 isoform X2 [Poeciliopsis prolifica]|uniref:plakophilin-1 isoform X2 n=1 Tax=Poeciliopsis prolifica TaxID=188132 RepID=UPI00241366E5|nr:plakophilin-1 isoform X2 [Poeciliopsis prolifica]
MDPGSPDTSLATPSDKDLSAGPQRVLHQVNTMKRTKSKYRNGATTSPTSPAPQSLKTSDFGLFKYRAASTYRRTNSSGSAALHNRKSKSMKGRLVSSNMEQVNTSSWTKSPNGLTPSRSDPTLTSASHLAPAPSMKAKRQNSSSQIQVTKESRSTFNGPTFTESQTRILQQPSTQSQTDGKLGTIRVSEIKQSSMVDSTGNMQVNITLREAVKYLSDTDVDIQKLGANYIQHVSFKDDSAKGEVFQLGGIPPLVNMLDSTDSKLQLAASGALRNLAYKNLKNKMAVHQCGGTAKILNQMKNTKSSETQKQLAGLLWNLSSAEELRLELISTALIAVTKNVVVPFNFPQNDSELVDPDVFYFATGCLRNLSSGSAQDRQKMRLCPKLIEALVTYINTSTVKQDTQDDKPVENCVCILHNLTYQLWQECPEASFSDEKIESQKTDDRKSSTVGCFSPRSRKMKDEIFLNPDTISSEVKWLYNSKAIDAYVSLLKSSQIDAIKEACCGAMQNLTAGKENESVAMSEALLKKLEENLHLSSLLWSKVTAKPFACLLDNMSRKSSLQSLMAQKILPVFGNVLSNGEWRKQADADAVATICKVLPRLLIVDQNITKNVINPEVIRGLIEFREKRPEDSGTQAASELLHNLWTDKILRSTVKHVNL